VRAGPEPSPRPLPRRGERQRIPPLRSISSPPAPGVMQVSHSPAIHRHHAVVHGRGRRRRRARRASRSSAGRGTSLAQSAARWARPPRRAYGTPSREIVTSRRVARAEDGVVVDAGHSGRPFPARARSPSQIGSKDARLREGRAAGNPTAPKSPSHMTARSPLTALAASRSCPAARSHAARCRQSRTGDDGLERRHARHRWRPSTVESKITWTLEL